MALGHPVGLFAAFVAVASVGSALYVYGTDQKVTFKVEDKERITETSGSGEDLRVSSKYLVYTDKGVYENTDSFLKFKFNSSDVYGQLKEGSTYECDTYGWRIPVFSTYPNIVSCEELAAPKP